MYKTSKNNKIICTAVVIFTTLVHAKFAQTTPVFAEDFFTGCDPGYYINPTTGRCNKVKVCKFGFSYNATTNSCHKISCPFGAKLSAEDSACHPVVCAEKTILSTAGNCVSPPAKITACDPGFAYNSTKKSCVEAPATMDDSLTLTNAALLPETVAIHNISETASTTGYDKDATADITAPEYADLRALITAYFEEQSRLEEAENTANASDPENGSGSSDSNNTDSSNSLNNNGSSNGANSSDSSNSSNTGNSTGSGSSDSNSSGSDPDDEDGGEPTCPDGKVYNPFTGRCKTAVTVTETNTSITTVTFDPKTGKSTTVKTCKEGYWLNEETNRCNKNSISPSATTKTCPTGQYLNPETNRCKKLVTTTTSATSITTTTFDPVTGETITVKTCIDGYELNPDTNRCVKAKNNDGSDYALDVPDLGTIESSPKTFIAIAVVSVAALIGLAAVAFQFRHDLVRIFKKLLAKLKSLRKAKS